MEKECTCKTGEPYNNLCCKVHGKCTCERPDDNTCDYCEEQEKKQILANARLNAHKQETLEEAANREYNDNLFCFEMYRDGFIEGGKWQQKQNNDIETRYDLGFLAGVNFREKLYSEQDMIKLIQFVVGNEEMDDFSSISPETAKYYFDRFLEHLKINK